MFDAMNAMLLDVFAAVARKNFEDRRRRQSQGQARAKAEGRYKGRPEDTKRNAGIAAMLRSGSSWSQVQATTGCSRATIAKIAKRAVVSSNEPVKPKAVRPRMLRPEDRSPVGVRARKPRNAVSRLPRGAQRRS
jgi:DNA invertase Pin-like site-specific DNA recombinase